jgi:hypothetical protein
MAAVLFFATLLALGRLRLAKPMLTAATEALIEIPKRFHNSEN